MLLISIMVGAVLLAMVAGVAWAKTFTCDPGSTEQDPCEGTRRADFITGQEFGPDYILAKRGKDDVRALGGNDEVHGGGSSDPWISGDTGDDKLYGEGGNDTIDGWVGHDDLYGGEGGDSIIDPAGPGFPFANTPADFDEVFAGPGDDVINVADADDFDVVCTGDGEDTVSSDAGDVVDDPNFGC